MSDRLRRDRPERTQPNRDWRTRTRPDARPPSAEAGPEAEAGGDRGDKPEGIGDVVRKGVELGYRVIEEQIRQGQRVAEEVSQSSYGPQAFTGDFRQTGERVMGFYQDAGQLWMQMLTTLLGGAGRMGSDFGDPFGFSQNNRAPNAPPPNDRSQGFERVRNDPPPPRTSAAPPSQRNPGAQIPIEIASAGPVRTSLDLRPEANLTYLATTELSAIDRAHRPLTGVDFQPSAGGGPPTLRIHVPEGSPAGTYVGVVVDRRSGETVGTLNVQVVA